jgi:hypothetical protein
MLSKDGCSFKDVHTASLSFACLFYAFLLQTLCHFTPLLNLCSLIFDLALLDWLHSITLTNIIFDFCLFDVCPLFQECIKGVK